MNLATTLREIKSHEFAARLNVVSSMPSFFAAASKEPAVMSLYLGMNQSGEAREEVLGYIQDLSQLEIDRRYENPHDTALAILLWATVFTASDYSHMAADLVDRAPQCWYAKKLARRILLPPPVASGDVWGVFDSSGRGLQAGPNSGDASLIMNLVPRVRGPHHYGWARVVASAAGNAQVSS